MTRARSLSRLANTNAFTVDASQRVGIGSTQPDVRLDVDGDMNVTGTLTYEDVTNVDTAGITTTGGLIVTGLGASIGGITTFTGDINFGAAGVGGTITTLGHAEFAGVVTASSYRGDGSQLTGVDSSNLVDSGDTNRVAANTSGVVITGITTTTDTVKAADGHVELLLDSGNGRIKLNSSGDATNIDLFGSDGSATFKGDLTIADKIIHDGDTDTVIRFPAANTFTAETAGSERLRITSSGRVVVGNDTERNNYDNGSVTSNLLHVERTAASGNAGISICANAATAADVGAIIYMGRTSATSNGGNTIVESGDLIGRITFQGSDGSELIEAAAIRVDVDGTPGANDMPGRIEFHTTPDGSPGASERMRIDSSGDVHIGNSAANANGHGLLTLTQSASSAFNALVIQQGNTAFTATDGLHIGIDGSVDSYIKTFENRDIYFTTGTTNTEKLRINNDGSIVPGSDDSQDLGSTSLRWANIYSADLQLSNEGKSNDVDGTWGKYTIQEGENDLFLLNRRNGKKYRFMLEEV